MVVVLLLVGLGVALQVEPAQSGTPDGVATGAAVRPGRAGQRRVPRSRRRHDDRHHGHAGRTRRHRRPDPRVAQGRHGLGSPAPAGCRRPHRRAPRRGVLDRLHRSQVRLRPGRLGLRGGRTTAGGHGCRCARPRFHRLDDDPEQQRRHPGLGQHRVRGSGQRLLVRRQRGGRGPSGPALPEQPRVRAGGRRRRPLRPGRARSTRLVGAVSPSRPGRSRC